MRISVVIPTKNRIESLKRTLQSFRYQILKVDEIIIVDSSDDIAYHVDLKRAFSDLPLALLAASESSVCIQRNIGIRHARCEWVFLCDDDIELPQDYTEKLSGYLKRFPECGAVAGRWFQMEHGRWVDQYPPKNFSDLLWRYIFQTSIWGDVSQIKPPRLLKQAYEKVVSFYRQRGNTVTRAGWPLITVWEDVFTASCYSLGASIVKRQWLLNSPYDEVLDANGIGDNFGVELGFPGEIHVVSSTFVYHHLEPGNRLQESISYYRRVLALHYFIRRSAKFPDSTRRWFLWSLIGNSLKFIISFRWLHAWATAKAITLILFNRNPYWVGFLKNQKIVRPSLHF